MCITSRVLNSLSCSNQRWSGNSPRHTPALARFTRRCRPCSSAAEGLAGSKPSWTQRLLADPALACTKVREEAGELCAALEGAEGPERAASEAADLLYHSLVLLNLQARTSVGPQLLCFGACHALAR